MRHSLTLWTLCVKNTRKYVQENDGFPYTGSMMDLIARTKEFGREVDALSFPSTLYVYNPLDYAWNLHEAYLKRYAKSESPMLWLGMNPGPFGMAQDGVPFGEVHAVKEYLHLSGSVGKPERMHPKRPIVGLDCPHSEPSGRRIWGFWSRVCPDADKLSEYVLVMNYCPLVFMDGGPTGRNVTPDKLPKECREALGRVCDRYLGDLLSWSKATLLVGVGAYAEEKLREAAPRRRVVRIQHPSPASPSARPFWDGGAIDDVMRQWRESGWISPCVL